MRFPTTSNGSDQPAHTRSLIMTVKLLIEQHVEFLSLAVGCVGSSESTHVKMSHCWKSHLIFISSDVKLLLSDFLLPFIAAMHSAIFLIKKRRAGIQEEEF